MRAFSLFSGIGGFDLALKKNNIETVGACEIDRYARQIYKKHFPDVPVWEDATKIKPEELPDFEMLCAGFPCQAFSVAGKRLGFEDTRGTIFYEIARIAEQKRPQFLLLENVKGLLSHDNGKTFTVILSTLDELGYDAEWQVINSKFFVPQNRERIFIIGHLRGKPRPKIFPIFKDSELYDKGEEPITVRTLTGGGHSGGHHSQMTILRTIRSSGKGSIDRYSWDKLMIRDGRDNRSTLRAGRTPELGFKGFSFRRLTPLECERLQGFPDGWTEGISDTQRYKSLGNAVTVPVVEYIMRALTKEGER